MTEPDPAEPVHPDGEAGGIGEARGAGDVRDTSAGPTTSMPPAATLRRAPRYRAFVLTGALVGIVLAILLTALFPDSGRFSTGSVMGYLAVALALIGGLLGAAVAVLIERPGRPH